MRRLPLPSTDTAQAFTACVSTMRDYDCLRRMQGIADQVVRYGEFYEAHAEAGVTYAIQAPSHLPGSDPVFFGAVTKSELVDLYKEGMVKRQSGRAIYDAIMVSAQRCPSCGDIGSPKTLDHYLPKANYPWLSICPYNLVPACWDCNTEKGNPVPLSAFEQLIHPYYDESCFFDDVWVFANVVWTTSFELEFYPSPPPFWGRLNTKRAIHHFDYYGIASKYSLRAAEELPVLIDQRRRSLRNLHPLDFQQYLADVANSNRLFQNHWRRVMYRALADNLNFCTHVFV